MAKWTVDVWDRSNGATLLNDGGICAAFPSVDAAHEIARKLNAYEGIAAIVNQYEGDNEGDLFSIHRIIAQAEGK